MIGQATETILLIAFVLAVAKFSIVRAGTFVDQKNHVCYRTHANTLLRKIEDFRQSTVNLKYDLPSSNAIPSVAFQQFANNTSDPEELGKKLAEYLNRALTPTGQLNDLNLDNDRKKSGRDAIITFCTGIYGDGNCSQFQKRNKNIPALAQLKEVYINKLNGGPYEPITQFNNECGDSD